MATGVMTANAKKKGSAALGNHLKKVAYAKNNSIAVSAEYQTGTGGFPNTNLLGLGEKHTLTYSTSGNYYVSTNSIANTNPLIFTVKNAETPTAIMIYETYMSGPVEVDGVTAKISRSISAADKDTSMFVNEIKIGIIGSGEA